MRLARRYWLIGFAFTLIFFASCGGGGGGSSGGGTPQNPSQNPPVSGSVSGGIVDAAGQPLASVDADAPVFLNLAGLEPNTAYSISVTAPDGKSLSPTGGFIATTDEQGRIPTSALIQDLSVTPDTSLVMFSGEPLYVDAVPGQYGIEVRDPAGQMAFQGNFAVADDDKVFCADASGAARASFTPGSSVFARIEKRVDLADGTYPCYVVSDLAADVEDQERLSGASTNVTVTGGVGLAAVGSFSSGQYDVICDIDSDGLFDSATDLKSRPGRFLPCFTIQSPNSGNHIFGQVCSDRHGNYRDIFDPNATDESIRDVWAWISPAERSLVEHAIGVRKYVVPHQTTWTNGDVLTDVTGASGGASFEVDAVQGFCTNEAPWLVWPRQRLTAGCYDCIIDVDADGIYDQGTDFVDNIDNTGDSGACGMRVAGTSDFITITSHTDNQDVNATAVTLAGTVGGDPVKAFVVVSSGAQSSQANLTLGTGGAFSADIPLFSGTNFLTVTGVAANGTTYAKTIRLNSTATSSANELFRIQLTWDGDTDMDLHLVRPGGAYANGGGGADDCNYANCKVGVGATSSNVIEWGNAGESDDPKLDVDCVACGSGIENIWMNEINQDGQYQVYIDAYSGNETAVSASVSVKGANVGKVDCGEMRSGTEADSCFVGTLTWSGGTQGSGMFTPVGTKAANF